MSVALCGSVDSVVKLSLLHHRVAVDTETHREINLFDYAAVVDGGVSVGHE
jgi:hypothetical protein